jgi:cell division protein FtsZ
MNVDPQNEPVPAPPGKSFSVKIFGVGGAGIKVMEHLIRGAVPGVSFVGVDMDPGSLADSSATHKIHLQSKLLRGLGTGGDPDRAAAVAEEQLSQLRPLCEGADVVFIIAGLAGGAGTGISPILAEVAKSTGALSLAFVTTPFQCEGSRRERIALAGLKELKEAADGVICLPNQKIFKLIDENTSVVETFKISSELLADAARGVWRLWAHKGLIEIRFSEVCDLIRNRHTQSSFAVAEAMGATRSREIVDKLFAHPMLDGGNVLKEAEAVLVSLIAGPDLTMAEVNRIMEQISDHCERAQLIMGAAIDEVYREKIAVTLIVSPRNARREEDPARFAGSDDDLDKQLLPQAPTARPQSRFVPPPPALAPEKMEQLIARQGAANSRQRKISNRLQQTQLPLEIISKGRFDKSEPTIHKGEDLDVPTYIRRGVPLN